jgi:addiction module RelE/StbE family toxin
MKDPFAKSLNNHALVGKYKGYRSINVTGDFRSIYWLQKSDVGIFVAIGMHSQLYR